MLMVNQLIGFGASWASYSVPYSIALASASTQRLYSGALSGDLNKTVKDFWIKLDGLGDCRVLQAYSDATHFSYFDIYSTGKIEVGQYEAGYTHQYLTTNAVISSGVWQNVKLRYDTTAGSGSRFSLIVDGTTISAFDTASEPGSSAGLYWNNCANFFIGSAFDGANPVNGNVAQVISLDGVSTGSATDGANHPIDPSGLTFGSYGFWLDGQVSGTTWLDAAGSNDFTGVNTPTQSADVPV